MVTGASHSLVFYLDGLPDPLGYDVSEETSERIQQFLLGKRPPYSFCWFSTLTGLDVAISLNYILRVNFLCDSPTNRNGQNQDVEEPHGITIHFRNDSKPYECHAEYPIEIQTMFMLLEDGCAEDPFLSFIDEDGEPVALNGRNLLHIEAASEILREAEKQMEQEEQEMAKTKPERDKPRGESSYYEHLKSVKRDAESHRE